MFLLYKLCDLSVLGIVCAGEVFEEPLMPFLVAAVRLGRTIVRLLEQTEDDTKT